MRLKVRQRALTGVRVPSCTLIRGDLYRRTLTFHCSKLQVWPRVFSAGYERFKGTLNEKIFLPWLCWVVTVYSRPTMSKNVTLPLLVLEVKEVKGQRQDVTQTIIPPPPRYMALDSVQVLYVSKWNHCLAQFPLVRWFWGLIERSLSHAMSEVM